MVKHLSNQNLELEQAPLLGTHVPWISTFHEPPPKYNPNHNFRHHKFILLRLELITNGMIQYIFWFFGECMDSFLCAFTHVDRFIGDLSFLHPHGMLLCHTSVWLATASLCQGSWWVPCTCLLSSLFLLCIVEGKYQFSTNICSDKQTLLPRLVRN